MKKLLKIYNSVKFCNKRNILYSRIYMSVNNINKIHKHNRYNHKHSLTVTFSTGESKF